MKTKTYITILSVFLVLFILIAQVIYLSNQDKHIQNKDIFVKIVALPDLAISSSTHYVRHRSLTGLFSIFGNSPTLSEYFPSTFVYNYSPIQKKIPSRIELEKK